MSGVMATKDSFDRRALVAHLLKRRGDALIVGGLGASTWDLAAADLDDRNVYLWGGMGLACSIGLGLAIAQPKRRVLVVTGDGEMMMGAGSLATIAAAAPDNLAILVLDNQAFGETGRQTGLTAGPTDIARHGRRCGHRIDLDSQERRRPAGARSPLSMTSPAPPLPSPRSRLPTTLWFSPPIMARSWRPAFGRRSG